MVEEVLTVIEPKHGALVNLLATKGSEGWVTT